MLHLNKLGTRFFEITMIFSILIIFTIILLFFGAFFYCVFPLGKCTPIINQMMGNIGAPIEFPYPNFNLFSERVEFSGIMLSVVGALLGGLVSSLVTLFAAFIAFSAVTKKQTESNEIQKEIERISLISKYEEEILQLFDEKLGMNPIVEKVQANDTYHNLTEYDKQLVNFRWFLRPDLIWESEKISRNFIHREILGLNMVLISDDGERLSSKALHETLMWFRKIDRAYRVDIIKNEDLAQMWRQIVPFIQSNRLTFMENYFGREDCQSIRNVALAMYFYVSEPRQKWWFDKFFKTKHKTEVNPDFGHHVYKYTDPAFVRLVEERGEAWNDLST